MSSSHRFYRRMALASASAALLVGLVAGCGGGDDDGNTTGTSSSAKPTKVALLLPETKTARYEARDRPTFAAALEKGCPNCELIYSNADQDAAKQQTQAEAALTNGAKVLVLDPVDSDAAAAIVTRANQSHVPVISYDRLVNNADVDYVVKFDNVKQGAVQAEALVKKLGDTGARSGPIVMINGSPTDANAKPLKNGAHSVIGKSGVKIAKEYDTPDWSPDKAQAEMEQALTALGKDRVKGVLVANDGMASGAIAALKSNGVKPIPPVTGLDAELAAVQRILRGDQYMTVYLDVEKEARTAAGLAAMLAQGKAVPPGTVSGSLNNGRKDVPGALLDPTPVTVNDIQPVLIKSGYLNAGELCTGDLKAKCTAAGIG
jgi:D-xylose transport system substrate-binding protein